MAVSAGGTGAEILTDASGDGGGPAMDIIRMGGQTDAGDIVLYVRTSTKTTPTAAELPAPAEYDIWLQFGSDCYLISPVASSGTSWAAGQLSVTACAPDIPGAPISYSGTIADVGAISASWMCSEAVIRIPSSIMTGAAGTTAPPVVGDNIDIVKFQTVAGGFFYDTPDAPAGTTPLGTYVVGDMGLMLQDPPLSADVSVETDNGINVTWDRPAENDAMPISGFRIFRDGVPVHDTGVKDPDYWVDDGSVGGPLKSGQTYAYTVATLNCQGPSIAVAAPSITPEYRPFKPGLAVGTPTYFSVPMNWNIAADAPSSTSVPPGTGASGVVANEVYRSDDSIVDDTDTLVATILVPSASVSDTSVVDGTTYFYGVRAVDAFGNEGPFSNIVKVDVPFAPDTTPPGAPADLRLRAGTTTDNGFGLEWDAAFDARGVDHYELRCTHRHAPLLASAPLYNTPGTASMTEFQQVSALNGGWRYFCIVRAVDASGNKGPFSNELPVKTFMPGTSVYDNIRPAAPNLRLLGAGLNYVNMDWKPSTDNIGVDLYDIYRSPSSGVATGGLLVGSLDASQCTATRCVFSDVGVTSSGEYHYAIQAVDFSANPSAFSTEIEAHTLTPADDVTPTVPEITSIEAPGATHVVLRWTAATDASGIRSYDIVRDGVLIASLGSATACDPTGCSFEDDTVLPSESHTYRVRAVDNADNLGRLSEPRTILTPPNVDHDAPATAIYLTASGFDEGTVFLVWNIAVDAGEGLDHYEVFRGVTPEVREDNGPIATTDLEDFTDTGLAGGATYYYKVRAVDRVGNAGAFSTIARVDAPDGDRPNAVRVQLADDHLTLGLGVEATVLSSATGGQAPLRCFWTVNTDAAALRDESCDGASFRIEAPGSFLVRVMVRDADGQEASDTLLVSITGGAGGQAVDGDATSGGVAATTTDGDLDGLFDLADNCPFDANTDQQDADGDGDGDACDAAVDDPGIGAPLPVIQTASPVIPVFTTGAARDTDADGYLDARDNCPQRASDDQADLDRDGLGDPCDSDLDGDGKANTVDNCPRVSNLSQEDIDGDHVGDACDAFVIAPAEPVKSSVTETPAPKDKGLAMSTWIAIAIGVAAFVGAIALAASLLKARDD